jgi:hypothetical protein
MFPGTVAGARTGRASTLTGALRAACTPRAPPFLDRQVSQGISSEEASQI